jgi:Domain of unknown function (DUF5062)
MTGEPRRLHSTARSSRYKPEQVCLGTSLSCDESQELREGIGADCCEDKRFAATTRKCRTYEVVHMKKLKHEAELFKAALLEGVKYAEGRKAVEFEPTDSASEKLRYIYRLLVHDKIIQPLPEDQVSEASMRHKLAIWYSKQLPKDHPLLK